MPIPSFAVRFGAQDHSPQNPPVDVQCFSPHFFRGRRSPSLTGVVLYRSENGPCGLDGRPKCFRVQGIDQFPRGEHTDLLSTKFFCGPAFRSRWGEAERQRFFFLLEDPLLQENRYFRMNFFPPRPTPPSLVLRNCDTIFFRTLFNPID